MAAGFEAEGWGVLGGLFGLVRVVEGQKEAAFTEGMNPPLRLPLKGFTSPSPPPPPLLLPPPPPPLPLVRIVKGAALDDMADLDGCNAPPDGSLPAGFGPSEEATDTAGGLDDAVVTGPLVAVAGPLVAVAAD